MSESWQREFDKLFIGGEWAAPSSGAKIEVISPSSEEVIGAVPGGAKADVDAAVKAARRAFDEGPWPRMALEERMAVITRFRDLLIENRDVIAHMVTSELGSPVSQSLNIQASMPVSIASAYLEAAQDYPFRSLREATTGNAIVTRVPTGVVAAVIPWNGPVAMVTLKLVPSLLAGCTVVLKPSPETPLSANFVAQLLERAGLPAGVLNVVPAELEASEYLLSHSGVDKVTFTGSSAAGRRIAEVCGRDLRRVTLELGGKSAAVILDDADIDLVVRQLRMGSFRNSGQICSLKTRVLVSDQRKNEVLGALEELVRSMPVGDPWDIATEIGPLVSSRQRQRVEGYQQSGKDEGATVVVGGGRPKGLDRGWYVEPTLFADVRPDMRIAQEEIFGPVLSVITFTDEKDAIRLANDSVYGLSGAVFSNDFDHALSVANQMRTGTVEINGYGAGLKAPMGGFKASGIGREYGPEGFDPYVETKAYGISAEQIAALSQ